eukprot:m.589776 g.589776  ORF g.589776 m.589776 type:complete len:136 (+) comp58009_c0_seq8:2178-2585(+)
MFTQQDVNELCAAVRVNKLADCKRIVCKCGKDVITATDTLGHSALHHAAGHNQAQVLGCFLEQQIDLNALNSYGETALIVAAQSGGTACVELLVSAGGDTSARSSNGRTAIEWARRKGHTDAVAVLEGISLHQYR